MHDLDSGDGFLSCLWAQLETAWVLIGVHALGDGQIAVSVWPRFASPVFHTMGEVLLHIN